MMIFITFKPLLIVTLENVSQGFSMPIINNFRMFSDANGFNQIVLFVCINDWKGDTCVPQMLYAVLISSVVREEEAEEEETRNKKQETNVINIQRKKN